MGILKVSANGHSQKNKNKMASVLTASTFNIDAIIFGKHKPNTNGGYNIDITLGNGTEEILIQTPKMKTPFGISIDKTNPFKKSLDVSFQGIESNPAMKSFREMVENIDSLAVDYALKNSKTFFKKDLSRDIVREYYNSGIKLSAKEQYSDTFKMRLLFLKPNPEKGYPNGKFTTTFWDPKGAEQNDGFLDKWDSVRCLIKPQMLWVANKGFGIQWVCTQVCVYKQQKISGFAFKKTEDDEDEIEIVSEEEEVEEVEVEEEEVEVDE
jgi:hypothetical protein